MSGVRIAHSRWFHACLAALGAWLPASTSLAQVKDVTPYYVVVTKDKADFRCGETGNFYRVLELKASTLLQVDGEAGEYARVTYPPGATVLVKAEEVTYDAPASKATLTQATRLWAPNALTGALNGSWKGVLPRPLPVGTALKVAEASKDAEGRVDSYRVVAPDAARGFVRRADVRQASAAEIEAARRTTPTPTPTPAVEAPRPGKTDDAPRPTAAGPTNTKDAPQTVPPSTPATPSSKPADKPAPAPGDTSLVEPMVKPGDKPVDKPAETPPSQPTATGQEPAAEPKPVEAPVAKEPPAPKTTTLQDLEHAFDALRRQNSDDAEYQAMIGEFQKIQDTIPASQTRLHKQVQGRIDWLQMKLEVRERQREIEDMKRKADNQGRDVSTKLADLERQRQYAIVGRLLPSNVYDGANLPLMYRLQSVAGGISPRTIGYIKPSSELDLPSKLNQVVGIIGEIKMDPAMSLNMISAQRIDILQAADGGPVRAVPAQPTQAKPEDSKPASPQSSDTNTQPKVIEPK